MKAIVGALLFLCFSVQSSWSASIGDLLDDIRKETHLRVLDNGTPAWAYDFEKGQSQAAITTSIVEYRFLTADLGWAHDAVDKGKGVGLGGGTIHIDKLFRQCFPNATLLIGLAVPKTMEKFYDKLSIGLAGGWDFDRAVFAYRLLTGLRFG